MEFDVHIDRLSHSINANTQTWTWQIRTSAGSEVGAWVLDLQDLDNQQI